MTFIEIKQQWFNKATSSLLLLLTCLLESCWRVLSGCAQEQISLHLIIWLTTARRIGPKHADTPGAVLVLGTVEMAVFLDLIELNMEPWSSEVGSLSYMEPPVFAGPADQWGNKLWFDWLLGLLSILTAGGCPRSQWPTPAMDISVSYEVWREREAVEIK